MLSICLQRGVVNFPMHNNERHYMIAFTRSAGLPTELKHWQRTVDQMLDGIYTDGPMYVMIDQKHVKAGQPHRRPGLHIDGLWVAAPSMGGWKTDPPRWSSNIGRHNTHDPHITQIDGEFPKEAILLATDFTASRAFVGEWDAAIGKGGDCSHVDTASLQELILTAGHTFAGNVTMLHETMPIPIDCLRTVVRTNVPGWSPELSCEAC
jgi:hypothetical protein